MSVLFEAIELGRLQLRNRIVMAPMTRSRAGAGDLNMSPDFRDLE